MSGAGPQLAAVQQNVLIDGRSATAQLLHALNQPLTGLQCSLELALASRRPIEHYIHTLSEGLELVSRMRVLVEGLRELADLQVPTGFHPAVILLDNLLHDVARELQPVAESTHVRLVVVNSAPLPIRADVGPLTSFVFRTIECVLSLARQGSEVRIVTTNARDAATINMAWTPGCVPEHTPFSRPEVGLLVARAGWEHLGGKCIDARTAESQSWMIRMPMAVSIHRDPATGGVCQ